MGEGFLGPFRVLGKAWVAGFCSQCYSNNKVVMWGSWLAMHETRLIVQGPASPGFSTRYSSVLFLPLRVG